MLIFSGLILLGHIFGIFLHLYDTIPQYNSLIHLIGGGWIASIVIYLIQKYELFSSFFRSLFLGTLAVASIVLTVELAWEFLEYAIDTIALNKYGVILSLQPSILDTIKDLGVGWIGGIVFSIWYGKVYEVIMPSADLS